MSNFIFWIKKLWKRSPGFVCLYLAEIPLFVGISLLTAYLPSVLTADITAAKGIGVVLKDLALVGGTLTVLYTAHKWVKGLQTAKCDRICQQESQELIKAAMNANYRSIETPDFQNEFRKLQELHIWSYMFTDKFMSSLTSAGTAIVSLILFTGMLSGVSPWILLLIFGSAVCCFYIGMRCNRWESDHRHTWWALDLKMDYLGKNLSSYEAAKDVHLYHMPSWLKKRYDRELKERLHYTVKMQAVYFLWGASYNIAALICRSVFYIYLLFGVLDGKLDVAQYVLYVGILEQFMNQCDAIVFSMKTIHEQALYVEENQKLLERLRTEPEEGKEELVLEKDHLPCIEFQNVGFWYEGSKEPTIRGLNLTIRPGENLALVGLNGAGKTTFIKLLCGFYDPTEGRILVNGVDRSRYTRESWFRCFSGVFQEAGFFPMSLGDNMMPEKPVDEERLWECVRLADLEQKLKSLPEGLDTLYGTGVLKGAVDFSGGEMQKLMLVRSLYKRSSVLVLDEPTAALDPIAESEMYEKYHQLSKEKTTVFISHRLASTRFCDRILLMENGEITEMGTHEELLKKDGKYAQMYHLQSKYYQQADAGLEGEVIL